MLPSLFVSHGAPLLAIEDNEYTRFLTSLGASLPKPIAIVIFSAHWESNEQQVSDVPVFKTMYDFGGFPSALYEIKYEAKGKATVTKDIEALFYNEGISYKINTTRGLDHGAWVVLKILYPDAAIPVISMSVNPNLTPQEQYHVGKTLEILREKDILIIASGGTVHNFETLRMSGDGIDDWAIEFDQWLERKTGTWDLEALFEYEKLAPAAELAVPPYAKEHFIPFFYAMGAADNAKKAKMLHASYRYGNLSHTVWQFG